MESPGPLHHQASPSEKLRGRTWPLFVSHLLPRMPLSPSPVDSNPGKSFLLASLPSSPGPLTWLNSALVCFYPEISILSFLPPAKPTLTPLITLHHPSLKNVLVPMAQKTVLHLLSLVWETLLSDTNFLSRTISTPHCVPTVLQLSISYLHHSLFFANAASFVWVEDLGVKC